MKQFDIDISKIDFNVFTKYLVGYLIDFLYIYETSMRDSLFDLRFLKMIKLPDIKKKVIEKSQHYVSTQNIDFKTHFIV